MRKEQPSVIRKEGNRLKEFKEFAMKRNVLDMAVGIIIGAAFGLIVTSLVNDVIMPPIGLLLGNADFSNIFAVLKEGKTARPYASAAAAKAAGAVTMNVGVFINTVIHFVIVAFAIFLLIRNVNRLKNRKRLRLQARIARSVLPGSRFKRLAAPTALQN